jgi:hypothetical protein
MTANISYKGTDLDNIYENPILGAATTSRNYLVAGVDISTRYTALSNVTTGNGNIAARIPPTGILTSAGTDLSSIFAGKPSNWAVTTPLAPTHAGFTSPTTLTHTFTVTFASAAALTNYFNYGGRITILPSQTGAGAADADLQLMFAQIGTLIIYDAGHYITGTGTGVVVNNPTVGGSNIGTTPTTFLTATEATLYTSNTYTVTVTADAAAGSATVLTVSAVLVIATHGTIVDTYAGTYTSSIGQRNYNGAVTPTQAAPTFVTTVTP